MILKDLIISDATSLGSIFYLFIFTFGLGTKLTYFDFLDFFQQDWNLEQFSGYVFKLSINAPNLKFDRFLHKVNPKLKLNSR